MHEDQSFEILLSGMKSLINSLKEMKSHQIGKRALQELPPFIFRLNGEGKFLDFFAADNNTLAVAPELIVGNGLSDLFPDELASQAKKHIIEELSSGIGTAFEYSLPINNAIRFFEAKLIREDANTVTAFVRDITEVRSIKLKEEEQLRIIEESEKKFRLLADHLPGAVYLCNNDADFSMIYLNEKVFEITGYEPQKFISKEINFPDIYHPDDASDIYLQVEESLAAKKSFHLEYRIRHKSGVIKWIEEFGTGVYNYKDELICLEGYLQDISQRKNAEIKIKEQNEALIKTNEELDRFVYSASHDLRSPLSSLLGLVNLAEATSAIDESKLLLEKMKGCVTNLDHFIREITYYSQNSRLEVEKSEISIRGIVDDCIGSLRHMDEARGILFDVEVSAQMKWLCDGRRLKIILSNLIANAIKYSDPRKSQRWVSVKADELDTRHMIAVEDNGLGIDEKFHPKIFDMFFRASEKSNGSGLGLYIVKEAISKLEGAIEFTSTVGVGSAFKIYLPK